MKADIELQTAHDTQALSLYSLQVDVHRRGQPPSRHTLDQAVAKASTVMKLVIFQRARDLRRQSWESDEPTSTATIPIFRALIASDQDDNFEYHGQLGYALKDRDPPAFAEAEEELSTAISIRDGKGLSGWLTYELNRAECRAEQNAPDDEIRRDLEAASGDPKLRSVLPTYPKLVEWIAAQGTTVDEFLAGLSSASPAAAAPTS